MSSPLHRLPSVERLLSHSDVAKIREQVGHSKAVSLARELLDEVRAAAQAGQPIPTLDDLARLLQERLLVAAQPSLRPVINATGVIIHTNLGRAPLSTAALAAIRAVGQGYSNLEYDLEGGKRGSRHVHAVTLLRDITGAEDALVVNNNAGAVFLALRALAKGREVIISRGQLIEIGGGFRIPDVMAESGAQLREVGTTNRTHVYDYTRAFSENTALVMRAHQSNFRQIGFVTQPSLKELVDLAHAHHVPLLDDLGSGTFLDTRSFGLAYEPTVQDSLQAGADLVTFSGDKLLGGPQAGIIVGKAELVQQLRRHPLARALRVDKMTLAALEATLAAYRRDTAVEEIPIWRMIATPLEHLKARAHAWQEALRHQGVAAHVQQSASTVGGGSLPGRELPTWVLALPVPHPNRLAAALRHNTPPIIARIDADMVLLDPRTVLPEQDEALIQGLLASWDTAS